MCRAYRCVVRSVDGAEVYVADSTSFCVKLFDDRFLTYPADELKDILAEYGFHDGSGDVADAEGAEEVKPEDAEVEIEKNGQAAHEIVEDVTGDVPEIATGVMEEDAEGGISADTEAECAEGAPTGEGWDVEAAMWGMIDRFWETAEQCVRREDAVYTKLDFMQSSLIPRYFGAHNFILADGHEVPGILMEYIPAQSLRNCVGRDLDVEQQIQLIKSVRHAVRVLQYADVSQHDWHPGQILCYRSEDGSVHGVLIDFAQIRQSCRELELRMENDAASALRILLGKRAWLDEDLVWAYFDPPEVWDPAGTVIRKGRIYTTDSPFKFVFDALNPSV